MRLAGRARRPARTTAASAPEPVRASGRARGSVTAELAIGLPAVVMVLVLVMSVGSAALAQVRCTDAARAAARAAALGADGATIDAIVADLAGEAAQVEVTQSADWVHVLVSRPIAAPWGADGLMAQARFSLPLEPGSRMTGAP
ncbi:MAG: TadE family type IV pilus minor pilin [Beutenbergiaceae bacterium]